MQRKPDSGADAAALFLKLYSNLPVAERAHVVLVLENEPISWEVARNEIIHKTKRAAKILKKLQELKII
ncbi:MAG: hypothetical protein ABIH83_04270 [Candidatus Micrarchaeota archaeon]